MSPFLRRPIPPTVHTPLYYGETGNGTNYAAPQGTSTDLEAVEQLSRAYKVMTSELGKVIVGQEEVVEQVLTAMFCQGHVLLVGVPGLAKTLLVKTISDVLHLSFKRVQFTPDLMPSDITGTEVLEEDHTTGKRAFRFVKGPLFANMVLADEINRTPPKTQAALLEAMQEHRVTSGENTYELPEPFFVLATQNPIEQEGTYPLPEAQLDRFMFMTIVKYPTPQDEIQIMKQATSQLPGRPRPAAGRPGDHQPAADRAPGAGGRARLPVRPRPGPRHPRRRAGRAALHQRHGPVGRRPRASIYLIMAGKARAILQRPGPRDHRGHRQGRPAGAAPPHPDHLQRRGRGHEQRQGDRAPAPRRAPHAGRTAA